MPLILGPWVLPPLLPQGLWGLWGVWTGLCRALSNLRGFQRIPWMDFSPVCFLLLLHDFNLVLSSIMSNEEDLQVTLVCRQMVPVLIQSRANLYNRACILPSSSDFFCNNAGMGYTFFFTLYIPLYLSFLLCIFHYVSVALMILSLERLLMTP